MKAAVVPKIGGKWEVKEVPTPHPATNQVLIKMHASGLCYTDVHITEGQAFAIFFNSKEIQINLGSFEASLTVPLDCGLVNATARTKPTFVGL